MEKFSSCSNQNTFQFVVDENRLRVLPAAIGNFVNLERLSLERNHIVNVPNEINHCQKLRVLSLARNEILIVPQIRLQLAEFNIDENPCRLLNNNNNNNTPSRSSTANKSSSSSSSNQDSLWNLLESEVVSGVALAMTKVQRTELLSPRKLDGHIPLTFAVARNNLELVQGRFIVFFFFFTSKNPNHNNFPFLFSNCKFKII